jgi:hypothetical protein
MASALGAENQVFDSPSPDHFHGAGMTTAMQQALKLAGDRPDAVLLVVYPTYKESREDAQEAWLKTGNATFTETERLLTLANKARIYVAHVQVYDEAQKFLSYEFHRVFVVDTSSITPAAHELLVFRERLQFKPKDPVCKRCKLPKSTHIQAYGIPPIWVCQVSTFEE